MRWGGASGGAVALSAVGRAEQDEIAAADRYGSDGQEQQPGRMSGEHRRRDQQRQDAGCGPQQGMAGGPQQAAQTVAGGAIDPQQRAPPAQGAAQGEQRDGRFQVVQQGAEHDRADPRDQQHGMKAQLQLLLLQDIEQ